MYTRREDGGENSRKWKESCKRIWKGPKLKGGLESLEY